MEKKEFQEMLEEFKNGLPKSITQVELESKFNDFRSNLNLKDYDKEIEELKSAMIEQGKKLAEKKEQTVEMKSLNSFLKDTGSLSDLKNKKSSEFEIKTVGTLSTANVVVADTAPKLSILGANGTPYAINRGIGATILDYVDMQNTDKASVVYVDEVEGEGTVGTTSEGNAKNQIDVDYKEVTVNSEKYTGLIKVTEEALDDVSFIESEINRVVTEKLMIAESAAVLAAIISAATTFSLTDFDDTVADADEIDAIVAAKAQSVISGFAPQHIVMHPVDIAKFQLTKSSNAPRIITNANGMVVDGLQVIATTQITKGTFVLGDFKKYRVRSYKRKLVMGYDSDDFSKNLRTLIAEHRFIKYVSTNEKTSFIKGTFATIKADLLKPAS